MSLPRIAIIGTRTPNEKQKAAVGRVLDELLPIDHIAVTGGAYGVDSMVIGNSMRIEIVLPWKGFNNIASGVSPGSGRNHRDVIVYDPAIHAEWRESVFKMHPNPVMLGRGAVALHARNYGIVYRADLVIAFPSIRGGGTEQGMRIARHLGVPCAVYPAGDFHTPELERDFFGYFRSMIGKWIGGAGRTIVLHKRLPVPRGYEAVYIGRPSVFGNPFSHLPHSAAGIHVASREDAVMAYAK